MMKSKKGQISLVDAPQVVMIVGLVFLIMATIALVSEKYQDSFPDTAVTVTNETATPTDGGVALNGATRCGTNAFAAVIVSNSSVVIDSANYTLGATNGLLTNLTSEFVDKPWNITHTYNFKGTSCNVTRDLNTEIANNTSIAGIILTISLVGIVLTILIGVFVGIRKGI